MSTDAPSSDPVSTTDDDPRDLNVSGILSIVVFYLVVLAVGVWAGWRQKRNRGHQGAGGADQEEVMLAGRNIGLFVGVLTMGGEGFKAIHCGMFCMNMEF